MSDDSAYRDFQPYLDAVIRSGDRTRTVWYVLVLILVAVFFGEWNTRPDSVSTTRFVRMMDALVCLYDQSWAKGHSASCEDGLRYAQVRHHFAEALVADGGPNEETKTELKKELEKKVEHLMRRELEAHVLTVPILGVTIDGNDLWRVSTFIIIFMLRILRASLSRELNNTRRASIRAGDDRTKRGLVIMAQLFSQTPDRRHPQFVLLFLPVGLYVFQLYDLFATSNVGALLGEFGFSTILQVILIVPIIYLCIRCFLVANQIEIVIELLD
jgi:hypothetical protein